MKNIVVEYLDLLGKTIVERKKQDSGKIDRQKTTKTT